MSRIVGKTRNSNRRSRQAKAIQPAGHPSTPTAIKLTSYVRTEKLKHLKSHRKQHNLAFDLRDICGFLAKTTWVCPVDFMPTVFAEVPILFFKILAFSVFAIDHVIKKL
jgi:hypothetical protein